MKKSKRINVFLFVSGIIGVIIGCALLFAPIAFEASSGILIDGNNINLLSELRASGGALLFAGILIVAGVFISQLKFSAILLSSMFYLSYALSRLLGMLLDGIPNNSIVYVAIIELVIGAIGAYILYCFLIEQRKEV